MNKKQIIQILVIAIAFGASGLVLYKGFFSGSEPPAVLTSGLMGAESATSSAASESLLPYGSTLNFNQVLGKQKLQFGFFTPPELNPQQDVGQTPQALFTPLSGTGEQQ